MEQEYPLPKPYKTGMVFGFPTIKKLLPESVKSFIDTMYKIKNSYIGIDGNGAWLFIDGNPAIKVKEDVVDDLKLLLADSVKEYHDIIEYRLTEDRYKQILSYYQY